MATTCKACGGTVIFPEGATVGICEYCGSTVTRSKIEDEQRDALHNRGNFLRMRGEYDRALSVFEQIIALDDTDAEAHWNAALCRYGIEYVKDPDTGKRIPTCHRANWDSILSDVDYLAALQYADSLARSVYESDGKYIDQVQKQILAISNTEDPYDIFICYKESSIDGNRTRDSVLAQDLYDRLTKEGYRVFFARVSLEDTLGKQYEPYIFSALNSAKVMLVVGTSAENINSPWVRNEWSRFLSLVKKDPGKVIIPCYRDMDPHDLPVELAVLQSQDMGKIGFTQDLLRGLKKVIPEKVENNNSTQSKQQHDSSKALLLRAQLFLKDRDWDKAAAYYERVLDLNPKCVDAYVGKLCIQFRCTHESQIADWYQQELVNDERNLQSANLLKRLSSYPDFARAIDFSEGEQKTKLQDLDNEITQKIKESGQRKLKLLQERIDELSSQISPLELQIKPIKETIVENTTKLKSLESTLYSERQWQNDIQLNSVALTNGCLPIIVIWTIIFIILLIIYNSAVRASDQFVRSVADLMVYVSTAILLIIHFLRYSWKNREYRKNKDTLEQSYEKSNDLENEIARCKRNIKKAEEQNNSIQPKLDELTAQNNNYFSIYRKYENLV